MDGEDVSEPALEEMAFVRVVQR